MGNKRPLAEALPNAVSIDHAMPRTIKWLKLLICGSVVVSIITFALSAWHKYVDISANARERVEQTVRMAQERTLKIFRANEVLLDRVQDLLAGMDDRAIRINEALLHEKLEHLVQETLPGCPVIVWGENGQPLVGSEEHYRQEASIAKRDYFRAATSDGVESVISKSPENGSRKQSVLIFSRRRALHDGSLAGVITASLDTVSITDFYKQVFGPYAELSVLLVRTDGTVLARHPPFPVDSVNLPAKSPVMQAMQRGTPFGIQDVVSPIDSKGRLVAFLKVGDYPVFTHVALQQQAILREWYDELRDHLIFLLPATILLVLAIGIALREARREEAAITLWRQEVTKRVRMQDELRQAHKLEAIGQLTGGLAHDFNNVLNVIHNYAQVLLKMPGANVAASAAVIERAVDQGQNITKHLLGFSRKQSLQPVVLHLDAFVSDVCQLLKHSLPSNIILRQEVAPDTWPIEVDRAELELALLNIVMNSRDAMVNGGAIVIKTMNIDKDDANSMSPALSSQDFVAISIADTGPGIAPDVLDRIFDPFFTTKEFGKGTGLGLSRVYGFAAQSGGTVTAQSPQQGGAVISLFLPRCEQSETPIMKIIPASEIAAGL